MKLSRPNIFGILNITNDSFSDGGLYIEKENAIAHAKYLLKNGANTLDIGALSTYPDAKRISASEEIARLSPILKEFKPILSKVSIDSYRTEVQKYCLALGVGYLNDTSGFSNQEFYPYLRDSKAKYIIMHSIQGTGQAQKDTKDTQKMYKDILVFFEKTLDKMYKVGISQEQLVLDPGMGFFLGSDPYNSIYVLGKLKEIKEIFSLPLLISVSRKSFLGAICHREVNERQAATLATEIFLWRIGVDYIRTHDPKALQDALVISEKIYAELE